MHTNMFTTAQGVDITVVLLPPGSPGQKPSDVESGHATVEFYDARAGTGDGPFMARYRAESIIEGSAGLRLRLGSPGWDLDAGTMNRIRAWIRPRLLLDSLTPDDVITLIALLQARTGMVGWYVTEGDLTRTARQAWTSSLGDEVPPTPQQIAVLSATVVNSRAYQALPSKLEQLGRSILSAIIQDVLAGVPVE